MSLGRSIAVVFLASLLTVTLVTANVSTATHRTVLDPDFVSESIEEEGGYELIRDTARESVASSAGGDAPVAGVNTTRIVDRAVTESYVQSQAEANVERAYAYLHGESDQLGLTVDTRPIKDNASAAVEAEVRNLSVAALAEESDAATDGPVNASMLSRMTENERGYEAVRTDFRENVREEVLDRAVEAAWTNTSEDEKLALVIPDYDPRDYSESEKAQLVDDRESEIRTALRERIVEERGDEIDARIEEQLADARYEATNGTADGEMEAATQQLQTVFVEGLTGDESYQEFSADLESAKADLAAAVGDRAREQLDEEFPDRMNVSQDLPPETRQTLEQARTGVWWLDRLGFILPAIAGLLVGLLYFATRSVDAVVRTLGSSMVFAGLPAYVGVDVAKSRLQGLIADAPAEQREAMEFAVAIVERVLDVLATQSLALTIGGAVLLAVWLVRRLGLVEKALDRSSEPSGRRL